MKRAKINFTAALLVIAAMLLSMTAACGSTASQSQSPPPAAANASAADQGASAAPPSAQASTSAAAQSPAAPVTIKGVAWSLTPGETDIVTNFAKQYSDAHPGVTVQFDTITDSYNEALLSAFAAGDPPDFFYANAGDLPTYAQKGLIEPIDDKLARGDIDLNDLVSQDYVLKYNGKTYSWANAAFPYMLYYNKDMFTAAGLNFPTEDWTWQDLSDAAKALTIKSGDVVSQYGFQCDEFCRFWFCNFWSNGGQLFDSDTNPTKALFNDQIGVAATDYMKSVVQTFGAAPPPGVKGALGFREAFENQKVAMTLDGMWMLSEFNATQGLNYGVTMIPQGSQGHKGWASVCTWVYSATGKNKDIAWDVIIKNFNGVNAQLQYADYGGDNGIGIPIFKSALSDPQWKPSANMAMATQQAGYSKPEPVFLNEGSWCWDLLNAKLQEALMTDATAQDIMDQIAQQTESDYLSQQ